MIALKTCSHPEFNKFLKRRQDGEKYSGSRESDMRQLHYSQGPNLPYLFIRMLLLVIVVFEVCICIDCYFFSVIV